MTQSKLTIETSREPSEDDIRSIEGNYYLPGEKVKLIDGRFHGDNDQSRSERLAIYGETAWDISQTIVKDGSFGCYSITYQLEGLEGCHHPNLFTNPKEIEHFYGVMINQDNQTWAVPMTEQGEVAGSPLLIERELSRQGRHCFLIGQFGNTLDGFFESFTQHPSAGEYYLTTSESPVNGQKQIVSSPWCSEASDIEIEKAVAYVQDFLQAEAIAPSAC